MKIGSKELPNEDEDRSQDIALLHCCFADEGSLLQRFILSQPASWHQRHSHRQA